MTLLSLILSVVLARDRLAAIGRAGFGLTIAMIGLMALLLVTQAWLVGQAGANGGGVAVGAILDAISQGIRVSTIVDWRCWDCSSPVSALGCTRYAGGIPARRGRG